MIEKELHTTVYKTHGKSGYENCFPAVLGNLIYLKKDKTAHRINLDWLQRQRADTPAGTERNVRAVLYKNPFYNLNKRNK